MYPWTETILVAILLYGAILTLFTKSGKELVREAFEYFPNLALVTPFALFICYWFYCANTGGMHWWPTATKVFCYFLFPCVIVWLGYRNSTLNSKANLWDAVAIACLWLPFDLHVVTRRPNPIKDALDWPIIAVSGVIIGLVFWVGLRRLENTKTEFQFSFRDLAITLGALVALAVVVIPLGKTIGFLTLKPWWVMELQTFSIPEILWHRLATWKFLTYLVKIYVTIAVSEEFLFRGIIQNFLDTTLSSKAMSLVVASLLFGSAHLNNGASSLHPSDWNGTYGLMASIAGLAYGWTFRRTSSLLYPMLLHALVDAIWHTLFN